MSKLLDSFLNGLAGSSGKSISDGLSDVSKGLKQIKQEIAEIIVKSDVTDSLNAEILTFIPQCFIYNILKVPEQQKVAQDLVMSKKSLILVS